MFDLFRSIYDFGFQFLSETSIELSEENKKSDPISYRKQVRIIFVWSAKKKKNFSKVEFFTYDEGLCVQCMHIGSYDTEPETLRQLDAFAAEQGYCPDFSDTRFHHEIYLGDPRRTAPEKLKTVLRHPIRRMK